jgi:hypothetical protein
MELNLENSDFEESIINFSWNFIFELKSSLVERFIYANYLTINNPMFL